MSYSDVLCPDYSFKTNCTELKEANTLVYVGMNSGPVMEIVAVAGETAWIREPITFRHEALVPLSRLRVAYPSPIKGDQFSDMNTFCESVHQ